MKYTTLGKTGLKVSRIGFGGWGIGGGAPVLRWKDMWKADDNLSKKSLLLAYQNGINFFDTALGYAEGHSERLIRETLKDQDIIVATKVPPLDGHWPARNININQVFPKEYLIDCARKSYKNLGGTIDILQLHVWMDEWFESEVWREAFKQLKKENIAGFYFKDPDGYEMDLDKYQDLLLKIKDSLANLSDWQAEKIGEVMQDLAKKESLKASEFFMILRVAISGKKITPPLNESLEILGKEKVLQRIDLAT